MRVRPIFECDTDIDVIFNNKLYELPAGSHAINDIYFASGDNEIYLKSQDIHKYTWGEMLSDRYSFGEISEFPIYKIYIIGGYGYEYDETIYGRKKYKYYINRRISKWSDMSNKTFEDYNDIWSNLMITEKTRIPVEEDVEKDQHPITVNYEWGDI